MTIRKILTTLALSLGALTSQAQTTQGTMTLNATGQVYPGCRFTNTSNPQFNFSSVAGRTATAQATISILCTDQMPYSIRAQTANRQLQGNNGETIVIRAFTDSARTNQITEILGLNATGNSQVQNHTIFLRAESLNGPMTTTGRGITQTGNYSGQFTFMVVF